MLSFSLWLYLTLRPRVDCILFYCTALFWSPMPSGSGISGSVWSLLAGKPEWASWRRRSQLSPEGW